MAAFVPAHLDRAAIHINDAGMAQANPLGLVQRTTRRADAMVTVVAVAAIVDAVSVAEIDAGAGAVVTAAKIEIKAIGPGRWLASR